MPPTILLRCTLIGAMMALIIQIAMFFIRKQPRKIWLKPLLKAAISGALLGLAGGFAVYMVAAWVAGFSQHSLVLLLSAIAAGFIVGLALQKLLERLIWRRLGWR